MAVLQMDMMVLDFYYFATQYRVDIPQFFHLLNLRCLLSAPGNFPKHFHGNLTKIDI